MFNTNAFRRSVLKKAIQGKLTQQFPEDGDAFNLLQSIDKEKQRLIKAGKIKKQKKLSPVRDDEIPFKIPDNWEWVRLSNILNLKIGKTPARKTEKYWNGNIPWIAVKDMNNGLLNDSSEKITSEAAKDKFQNHIAIKGTMLMSFKLSIGKTCILDCPAYYNEAIVSFNFYKYENILKPYLFKNIGYLTRFAHSKSAVKGNTLNKNSLNHMLIPIPPLKEQKRIVQKIDKCFKLADLIDEEQKLTQDFDNDMHKSLLQSAMQGKLTQQSSEDGDASDLLQSIDKEKQRLIKSGKIKKQKELSPVRDDEIPFKIPDNWQWTRLNNIVDVRDGTHNSPKYINDGIPLITSKNIKNGFVSFDNVKFISKKDSDKINERSKVDIDDILMPMIGTIGNPAINSSNKQFSIKNIALIKKNDYIYIKFIYLFILFIQERLRKNSSGAVQSFISLTKVRNMIITLPPLAEQKRIVNKLDSMFEHINNM